MPKAAELLGRNAMGQSTGPDVFTLNRKDGSQAIVEIRTHPVRIGDRVLVLGAARDITDHKRVERELRKREQRYGLAVDGGKVGVWDWDLETNEIYLDPILKGVLGFKDSEIRNHIDDWGKQVHSDDVERVMAEATAHLEGRRPQYEVEHRMLCKNGCVRWYLARGTAIRDEDGKPCRMVGTDTDITELKAMQENLRKAHDDLEQRVEERTAELRSANEQLQLHIDERQQMEVELVRTERLRALGELSAGISHNEHLKKQAKQLVWSGKSGRVIKPLSVAAVYPQTAPGTHSPGTRAAAGCCRTTRYTRRVLVLRDRGVKP